MCGHHVAGEEDREQEHRDRCQDLVGERGGELGKLSDIQEHAVEAGENTKGEQNGDHTEECKTEELAPARQSPPVLKCQDGGSEEVKDLARSELRRRHRQIPAPSASRKPSPPVSFKKMGSSSEISLSAWC